jgi:biopolymer transport protein ExbD
MAFNTQGDNEPLLSEINVTPLVDVMLVLLVVFIVTAPLLSNAVNVVLPKTVATAAPEVKRSVSVTIDRGGKIYLDGKEIAVEALDSNLKQLKAGTTEMNVHLQADDGVGYGRVAKVMALIQRAGVGKLSVLTAVE